MSNKSATLKKQNSYRNAWMDFLIHLKNVFHPDSVDFKKGAPRIMTIDFLRGLSLWCMCVCHSVNFRTDLKYFFNFKDSNFKLTKEKLPIVILFGPFIFLGCMRGFFVFISGITSAYLTIYQLHKIFTDPKKSMKCKQKEFFIGFLINILRSLFCFPMLMMLSQFQEFFDRFYWSYVSGNNVGLNIPMYQRFNIRATPLLHMMYAVPLISTSLFVLYYIVYMICYAVKNSIKKNHKRDFDIALATLITLAVLFFIYAQAMGAITDKVRENAIKNSGFLKRIGQQVNDNATKEEIDSKYRELNHGFNGLLTSWRDLWSILCLVGIGGDYFGLFPFLLNHLTGSIYGILLVLTVYLVKKENNIDPISGAPCASKKLRKTVLLYMFLSIIPSLIAFIIVEVVSVYVQGNKKVIDRMLDPDTAGILYASNADISFFNWIMCLLFCLFFLLFENATAAKNAVRTRRTIYFRRFSTYSCGIWGIDTCLPNFVSLIIYSNYIGIKGKEKKAEIYKCLNSWQNCQDPQPILVNALSVNIMYYFVTLILDQMHGIFSLDWIYSKLGSIFSLKPSTKDITDYHLKVKPVIILQKPSIAGEENWAGGCCECCYHCNKINRSKYEKKIAVCDNENSMLKCDKDVEQIAFVDTNNVMSKSDASLEHDVTLNVGVETTQTVCLLSDENVNIKEEGVELATKDE